MITWLVSVKLLPELILKFPVATQIPLLFVRLGIRKWDPETWMTDFLAPEDGTRFEGSGELKHMFIFLVTFWWISKDHPVSALLRMLHSLNSMQHGKHLLKTLQYV